MKNIKYILFIIVLLFTSCALKKEYIIGDSKGITAKKIVKAIEQEFLNPQEEEKQRYDGALRRRQLSLVLAGKMKAKDASELKALFK